MNANNKLNRWGLELTTYNITFKWILGFQTKQLNVTPDWLNYHMIGKLQFRCPLPPIMMDQHFNTRNRASQHNITEDLIPPPQANAVTPDITTITDTPDPMLKPLTEYRLHTLLQMQRMEPFCKGISKHLSNGKAPKHEADLFLHVKGLLYKHVTDSNQKFLALVIQKAWKYTVLVEAHDNLGHQGAMCTYCLIKCQYYWRGMHKDIRKNIANCTLCHRDPLQMTEIPKWPFHKIAIDVVTECKTSTSGNKHILTIIDHLTSQQIPYYPHSLITKFQFTCAIGTYYQTMALIQPIGINTSIKFFPATEWHQIVPQWKHHFFLSRAEIQTYHYINF